MKDNVVGPKPSVDAVRLSMHYVPMSLGDVRSDHSLPALLLSIIFLALIPLGPFFARCLNALKPGFLTVNFEVDEDLPNYF